MGKHDSWLLNNQLFSWGHTWQTYGGRILVSVAYSDSFAKFSTEQFPGRFPTIALNQTTRSQNSLPAYWAPNHARLLHTLSNQCFTGGFHHTASDGRPCRMYSA